MLEQDFFNSNNLNNIYNDVKNKVQKNTSVDINKHVNMRHKFQKMAHIILNKFNSPDITLLELNSKLNTNAVSFYIDLINQKKKNKKISSNIPLSKNINENIDEDNEQNNNIPHENNNIPTSMNASINELSSSNDYSLINNNNNLSNYTIDKNLPEMIGNNLPLINNIEDLDNTNTNDINLKVDTYLKERNNIISNDNNLNDQKKIYNTPLNESVDGTGIMNHKNAELVSVENKIRKNVDDDKIDEYNNIRRDINNKFADITKRIENTLIQPKINEKLFNKLIETQKNKQPDYISKSNYIIVNSGDRDWLNLNISSHNRYNFNVKFGNQDNSANINDVYKNITSIELVNCFMPKDNVLIPFDARTYIDILSYPYLVLKVPELTNVFRGTNKSTDNAFSVLIYDKKHDSQVLSTDFIDDSSHSIVNGSPKRQFYSEYNKSFYKYIPAYFEKKVYDNQPLASLNHMTIKIVNPNNEDINVMPDVLSIKSINFTNDIGSLSNNNFEYDLTNSFPNDNNRDTREYIRIETDRSFSNKLFRLGDNIKIKGLTTTSSSDDEKKLLSFLNRDEGHYILNFDITDYTNGGNQGFTSNLYISPPGDLQLESDSSLKSSTYIDSSMVDTNNIIIGTSKLLNINLQTHFLFKLNTRQGNYQSVNNAMNV